MPNLTYKEVIDENKPICEKCAEILKRNNGTVNISSDDSNINFSPQMWRHSIMDVYHAWVLIEDRYIFICGTNEFDEKNLKRIRPLKMEENYSWTISIKGKIYQIIEFEGQGYEILNEDRTIVKDEEIEAKVFNYMMRTQD